MFQLWPGIVGDHFVIAAYNTGMYDQMTPLVNAAMDLDSKIAKALGKGAAAEYFEATRTTHAELSRRVGEILAASFRSSGAGPTTRD